MAKVTVRDKIAPYIEQGLSAKEIRGITGLNYKTIYSAMHPEMLNKKKKKSDKPKGWCLGWNKDRKKCRTCQYRSPKMYFNNCDYILHEERRRGCSVDDCDKYVRGKRLRINEKGGWNAKEDDFNESDFSK